MTISYENLLTFPSLWRWLLFENKFPKLGDASFISHLVKKGSLWLLNSLKISVSYSYLRQFFSIPWVGLIRNWWVIHLVTSSNWITNKQPNERVFGKESWRPFPPIQFNLFNLIYSITNSFFSKFQDFRLLNSSQNFNRVKLNLSKELSIQFYSKIFKVASKCSTVWTAAEYFAWYQLYRLSPLDEPTMFH